MKIPMLPIETLLIGLTIAGIVFLPEPAVPLWVWPLLLGLGSLILVIAHSIPRRTLMDDDLAPLLASVMCLTLAAAIPLEHPRRGVSFLVALLAAFVAGVVWSAWRATLKR